MALALVLAALMDEEELLDAFCSLFAGNNEYLGTEHGGCVEMETTFRTHVWQHLSGKDLPIGVYPIRDNLVKWGCVDFDEGDEESLIHARNVQAVLNEFGIHAYKERSRSKGFHVWVFAASWVVASLMREALLVACDLVDAPTREINPKQVELAEGQVGNYVRLPYPGALEPARGGFTADRRRVIVDRKGLALPIGGFMEDAMDFRCSVEQLEELAAFHKPSREAKPQVYTVPSEHYTEESHERMKPLTKWIYKNGPASKSDRSSALWKFACMLAEDGRHTHYEALKLLTEADAAWGKFYPRSDGELRLNELLDKAWMDRATVYEGA